MERVEKILYINVENLFFYRYGCLLKNNGD